MSGRKVVWLLLVVIIVICWLTLVRITVYYAEHASTVQHPDGSLCSEHPNIRTDLTMTPLTCLY